MFGNKPATGTLGTGLGTGFGTGKQFPDYFWAASALRLQCWPSLGIAVTELGKAGHVPAAGQDGSGQLQGEILSTMPRGLAEMG